MRRKFAYDGAAVPYETQQIRMLMRYMDEEFRSTGSFNAVKNQRWTASKRTRGGAMEMTANAIPGPDIGPTN